MTAATILPGPTLARGLWTLIAGLIVEQAPRCACDPRHIEVGGFDRGCPRHDRAVAS